MQTLKPRRLARPAAIDDLLLYRLSGILATAGNLVIRLCEGQFRITRREWRILAQLATDPGLLSSQLAERAHLDRARTSRAISSLVAKKLVRRETGTADRRQARVALTPAGQALFDTLFPLVCQINQQLLDTLASADVQRLDRMLDTLQAQAEAMQGAAELPKADRRRGGRAWHAM